MSENPRLRERPAWRVVIPAHAIDGRRCNGELTGTTYEVAASSRVQFEPTRRAAIMLAVTAAHVDAGVPCWRPYLRETARQCSVDRIMATAAGGGQ